MANNLSIEIGSYSIRAIVSQNGKTTYVPLGFSSSPYSCPSVAARVLDDTFLFGEYAIDWLFCSPGNFYHIHDIESGSKLLDVIYENLFKFVLSKVRLVSDTPVDSCTIIVPAYYATTDPRKNRIYQAAMKTGIKSVSFQSDAIAVCLKAAKIPEGENVMVFDFGYSGLTVSILQRQNNSLNIVKSIRNTDISGRCVDGVILEDIEKQLGHVVESDTLLFMRALSRCAERVKEELTVKETCVQSVIKGVYTIERNEFVNKVANLFPSAIQSCKDVINQAGLNYTDIHQLLLCGGCSNMPFVTDFLYKSFIANNNSNVQIVNLATHSDYQYLGCYGSIFSSNISSLKF